MKTLSRIFFCITFIFITNINLNAQDLDKIKKDANSNNSNRNSNSNTSPKSNSNSNSHTTPKSNNNYDRGCNNSYSNYSLNTSSDSYDEIAKVIGTALVFIGDEHTNILDNKETIPEVISAEFIADANISQTGSYLFQPRLRASWGLITTDARFYSIVAKNSEGKYNQFSYFDWQPIMINLFAKKEFKWRIGTGVTHEYFTGNNYNEHTTQFEVAAIPNIVLKAEGRWAQDYTTKVAIRKEAILTAEYEIKTTKHCVMFLGVNASFNNLYETNKFWMFGPSFRIRVQ